MKGPGGQVVEGYSAALRGWAGVASRDARPTVPNMNAARDRMPVIPASFCIVCPWLGCLRVISTKAGTALPAAAAWFCWG